MSPIDERTEVGAQLWKRRGAGGGGGGRGGGGGGSSCTSVQTRLSTASLRTVALGRKSSQIAR